MWVVIGERRVGAGRPVEEEVPSVREEVHLDVCEQPERLVGQVTQAVGEQHQE